MTELVRFNVCGGQSVVVEVDGVANGHHGGSIGDWPGHDWYGAATEGSEPVGRRSERTDLGRVFDSRLGQVRDAAAAALEILKEASSPDEIKLSLGIKLTQEAGAIIARTALEGNMAVELVWKRNVTR